MEQIETQVSDLRYLTSTPGERRVARLPPLPAVASPASIVSGENQHSPAHNHTSSADGPAATPGSGAKRKAEEDGEKTGKAQRSKRNRVSSTLAPPGSPVPTWLAEKPPLPLWWAVQLY